MNRKPENTDCLLPGRYYALLLDFVKRDGTAIGGLLERNGIDPASLGKAGVTHAHHRLAGITVPY